ncbi:hypothetical protein AAK899_09135 [Erysipelotrichaceae bacterium 51-3]
MDENKNQVPNEKPVKPNESGSDVVETVEVVEEEVITPVDSEDRAQNNQEDGIKELAGYGKETPLEGEIIDSVPSTGDEEAEVVDPEVVASLDNQIKDLMKKYKMTMWALIACIVVYLLFLFVIKTAYSTWIVLGICVVMIGIAVYNTKISRQVQKLALEKRRLTHPNDAPAASQPASGGLMGKSTAGAPVGEVDSSQPIVANATSLNDLPKQYTVLDDVEFGDGQRAANVVVSPYGIAVVGNEDLRPEMEAILQEEGLEDIPVSYYNPDEEVSSIAEKIQEDKMVVLDENKIMSLLLKLTGIKR